MLQGKKGDWMKNTQCDQKEFYEQMCLDTWKELYRFIYYKVQNREEAQDITQETYARAFTYLNRKEVTILEYGSYLKAISMNIIRDQWRAKKRRGTNITMEDVNPEEMAEDDFVDAVNNRALIEDAMEKLTKEQQMVITLRIIKGYSVAETAKLLKKKEGTIRVLQHRAVKALSEMLQDTTVREEDQ
jgi:RNA polymerase sigma-70 factor (ECF subfamily)